MKHPTIIRLLNKAPMGTHTVTVWSGSSALVIHLADAMTTTYTLNLESCTADDAEIYLSKWDKIQVSFECEFKI